MNLDFRKVAKKNYNKNVTGIVKFYHTDVVEPGGELEVTDHGWTDSNQKFLAGNRGEKSASQGLTGIPNKSEMQDAQTPDSLPHFFSSLQRDA